MTQSLIIFFDIKHLKLINLSFTPISAIRATSPDPEPSPTFLREIKSSLSGSNTQSCTLRY